MSKFVSGNTWTLNLPATRKWLNQRPGGSLNSCNTNKQCFCENLGQNYLVLMMPAFTLLHSRLKIEKNVARQIASWLRSTVFSGFLSFGLHISTHILIHQLLGRISKIKLLCPNFSLLCFWRTLSQWDFLWVANGVTNWAEMLEVSSCFHFAAKERKNVQSLYSKTIAVPGILTNVPNT